MTRIATYLPTAALLAASMWGLKLSLEPSAQQEIFIWSHFRFTVILIILGVNGLLFMSLFSRKAVTVNNWAIYIVFGTLTLMEAGLRSVPNLVPSSLIRFLPLEAREDLAAERGFFTDSILVGDGMVYRFKPHLKIPAFPWVHIDANGYRNPYQGMESIDIVLLGDSVTIALQADRDIADLFRDAGFSTVNYGQGGYGPFQYRDVYRQRISDPKVPHRALVVIVTGTNDFDNALQYARLDRSNATYRDYLGNQGIPGLNVRSNYFPWIVAIAINSLPSIKAALSTKTPYSPPRMIKFPYAEYLADENQLRWEVPNADSLTWKHFTVAINELLAMADDLRVPVLVVYHPPPVITYGQFALGAADWKHTIEREHDGLIERLKRLLDRPNVRFIDLTETERAALEHEEIGIMPMDTHLNTRGTAVVAAKLIAELYHLGIKPDQKPQ